MQTEEIIERARHLGTDVMLALDRINLTEGEKQLALLAAIGQLQQHLMLSISCGVSVGHLARGLMPDGSSGDTEFAESGEPRN